MQLLELRLRNFRQFRDESIRFASGSGENVTVIHGSNGAGKTTLLNAFTWVLYGSVDFDMPPDRPDRLATEGTLATAAPGDEIEVSVTLEFTHEGVRYSAVRTQGFEKKSGGDFEGRPLDWELVVEATEDGTTERVENGQTRLKQIVPERLSDLFFFDGEDIDELAGVDNQAQIREAIQNIMGLTILERATRHLDHVAGQFEDEFAEYGSEELNELIEERRELEDEVERLERKRRDKGREQERLQEEVTDIEQRLSGIDDSSRLQRERSKRVEEREELKGEAAELTQSIRDEIGSKGYAPVAMPLVRETAEELDELRRQGVIPSNLTDEFVDDLLDSRRCICGRELDPGSEPHEHVAALRGEAPAEGVEREAIRVIGQLERFAEDRTEFVTGLEQHVEQRKETRTEIERIERKIDDISAELSEMDDAVEGGRSIQDWENERAEKERRKEAAVREEARIEQRIEDRNEEIETLEEAINEQREERQEAVTARRRQRAAEIVRDEIDDTFDDLKQKIRRLSDQTVKETFGSVARKDLEAEITEEFELKICQQVADGRVEVEKSTGERQIASLAFIGSLVKIARQRYESSGDAEYFTGGIYPLVMDSPFGALDKEHSREVSRILPTLASQVVVFATDAQWEGPVAEEMADVAGEQYRLYFDAGEHPHTQIERKMTSARV